MHKKQINKSQKKIRKCNRTKKYIGGGRDILVFYSKDGKTFNKEPEIHSTYSRLLNYSQLRDFPEKNLILETNIYTEKGSKFYYVIPLNNLNHPNLYVIINKNDPREMILVEQSISDSHKKILRSNSRDSGISGYESNESNI